MDICKLCNSNNTKLIKVKEKFHGTFDEFNYIQCLACKSLIIKEIPKNLSNYYPSNYYSFKDINPSTTKIRWTLVNSLKEWTRKKYWQYIISKKPFNIIGFLIAIFKKQPENHLLKILGKAKLHSNSKVFDIGCGGGDLLKKLYGFGYSNVFGLDPNIQDSVYINKTKLVIKSDLIEYCEKTNKRYDLIMFNHSFEHIFNPDEVLVSIKKLSHEETFFIIRVPLADSYAFEHYKENWVQLDAPRHLYLFSKESMLSLLKKHGFETLEVIYDSKELQFLGSEQYKRDIPLISENSYATSLENSIFTIQDVNAFKAKAIQLNSEEKGDMAAFIFKIKSSKCKL